MSRGTGNARAAYWVKVDPETLTWETRFCPIAEAVKRTGMTEAAMRCHVNKGTWAEGRHFVKRDKRVYIDMVGVDTWIQTGA